MLQSNEFRLSLDAMYRQLQGISESTAAAKPAPDKWSIKEIIGHLIDSASNNHQRFVRAQFQNDLIFLPYAQEEWVRSQQYQESPWKETLDLWFTFNRHLARVMESTPQEILVHSTTDHNFDQIAWKTVPKGEPSTLEYFMNDYIGHFHNHLRQIEALLSKAAL